MMSADANMSEERSDGRSIVTFAAISRKCRHAVGTTAKQFCLLFRIGNEMVKLLPASWSAASSQHKPDFVLIVAKQEDVWILTVHPDSPIIDNILVITGLHHGDDGVKRQEKLQLDSAVLVKGGEVLRLIFSVGTISEEFSMMMSDEDQTLPAAQKRYLDTLPVVVHRLIAEYLPWTTWLYTLPFVSTKLFELAKSGLPFPYLRLGEMIIPSTGDLKALCAEAVSTCRVLSVERPRKALGRAKSGWYPRHPHWSATVFTQFRWRHLVDLTLEVGGDDVTCTSGLQMAFRKGNFPVLEELSLGVMKGKSSWDVLFGAHLPKLVNLNIRVEPAIHSQMAMSNGNTFWARFTTLRQLHVVISHQTLDSAWEHLFPKPTGPILPELSDVKITGMLARSQETQLEELSIFRHSPVKALELDSLGANGQRLRRAGSQGGAVDNEAGEEVVPLDIEGSTIASSFPCLEKLSLPGGKYWVKWNSVSRVFLARLQVIECDLLFEGILSSLDDDPRIPPHQEMKNLDLASLFLGAECALDAAVVKLVEILSLPMLRYLTLKGGLAINTLMAAVEKVQGTEGDRLEEITHLALEVHQTNARQTAKVPRMLERFRGLELLGLLSAKRIVKTPFRHGAENTTHVNVNMLANAFLKKNPDWVVLHESHRGVIIGQNIPGHAPGFIKMFPQLLSII